MAKPPNRLAEVAGLFFRLGWIAFGGPGAHIAMMEEEVVEKRQWMDRQHFLDLMGATNLIPGPNSTEMTMHCGHERAGLSGLFVAGICFIFPAALLTGFLGFLYAQYGKVPAIEPFLYGIKPAVLALILSAIYKLGKKALKNWQLKVLGALVIATALLGVSEVVAILGAGVLGMLVFGVQRTGKAASFWPWPLLLQSSTPALAAAVKSSSIFWVFLKIGAVLFGSGYVLVAYLQDELVIQRGWITEQVLLDSIAIGQFTPGPVLTTATFIGYQLNGLQGALLATLGIFLPSFLFVWLLNPLVPKLRQSAWASAFLDAVNVAAVAVMTAVTIELGRSVLTDWRGWAIAVLAAAYVFGAQKYNALILIAGGALLGYLLKFM